MESETYLIAIRIDPSTKHGKLHLRTKWQRLWLRRLACLQLILFIPCIFFSGAFLVAMFINGALLILLGFWFTFTDHHRSQELKCFVDDLEPDTHP